MDKLFSADELSMYLTNPHRVAKEVSVNMARQLLDTMRENERLREAIQFFFDKPGDSEYDIAQCEDKFKKALSYKDPDHFRDLTKMVQPTQNLVREGHSPGCALPDDHEHACGGFIRIPTKTPE